MSRSEGPIADCVSLNENQSELAQVQHPLLRFLVGRQQQTLLYINAHSQHIESHLDKKKSQAKIPIVFLFNKFHFTSVTSDTLFHGGHLVMHSKRCAV